MEIQTIQNKIFEISGLQVMLDVNLATLYGTETKVLKQSVRRNRTRFPPDFMFELTATEIKNLRSQFVTSSWGGTRYKPFAFTEQGVAMLASILNSPKAIKVNIGIVRAFVLMRRFALSHKDLSEKLKSLETKYNMKFNSIDAALVYLLKKDALTVSQEKRARIGFKTRPKKS